MKLSIPEMTIQRTCIQDHNSTDSMYRSYSHEPDVSIVAQGNFTLKISIEVMSRAPVEPKNEEKTENDGWVFEIIINRNTYKNNRIESVERNVKCLR